VLLLPHRSLMTILAQSLLFLSLALNYIRPTESIQLQQQKIKKQNKIKKGGIISISLGLYIYTYIYICATGICQR
jgi:archaellum biogenesis protein FlaJ (TadC family)